MRSEHDVLVAIDPRFGQQIAADWLVGIARITLEMERVGKCELGIVVTDDDEVRALNRQYAGEDHATDVLSFSLREGADFVHPDETERLGEVVISMEMAEKHAQEGGHNTDDEVAHLLVHGILHLLGHDHVDADGERVMRARERSVLAEVGYAPHPHP